MKKFKQSLVVLVSLLVLGSLAAIMVPSLTRGQGKDIANPQPLNVNVVNTPLPIRDVENPARQPFYAEGQVAFGPDTGSVASLLHPSLPSDSHGVLEYITTECELPSGQRPSLRISQVNAIGGYERDISFPVLNFQVTVPFGVGMRDVLHSSDPVRIYLPPGNQILVQAQRSPTTSFGTCQVYVSGFLVNVT